MNPYIQVGRHMIDLFDPPPVRFAPYVRAIAHLPRHTGHVGSYSVAQHCVIGAQALHAAGASLEVQAAFLIHDLHEAVTGDISAPVKRALRKLANDIDVVGKLEHIHEQAVHAFFGLPPHLPDVVAMDRAMCIREAHELFGGPLGSGWPECLPMARFPSTYFDAWTAQDAGQRYMLEAARLGLAR